MWSHNRSNSKLASQRGFTLIELLVTTALSIVLTGGVLAAYNSFNTRQTHVQLSKGIISQLERAKSRASAGEKPAECDSLTGFRVSAANNATSYQVSIVCPNQVNDLEVNQYYLPADYSIVNEFEVVFPSLPRQVASSEQVIDVARNGFDQYYRIVIHPNGSIGDEGLVTP